MPNRKKKKRRPFRLSFRNRSLTFTPLGTRFVVITVLIGFAAINTGGNLLYLCTSMLLSMMIVSGILSEQALKGLAVARRLPDEMYAATPFSVRYGIANRKARIPSFALTVSGLGAGGEEGAGAFVLRVPAAGDGAGEAHEVVGRRGPWETKGFTVSTVFPFGLFRKTLRIDMPETALVYPKLAELPSALPRELTAGFGETPSGAKGQGMELLSIREYRPSDEARLIHWKSSARLSRLMAKEFEAEKKRTVTLVLDDSLPDNPSEVQLELFEEAVSLAASCANQLILEHDLPVALVCRGAVIPAGTGRGHYMAVLDALARIKYAPRGSHQADLYVERAFADGACVLALPGGRTPWSGYSGRAALTLEAGR